MRTWLNLLVSLALVCGGAFVVAPAVAATKIVAFGGGNSPDNDQVSLLSNISYFNRVRALLNVDKLPCDVYFADGGKDDVVQATAPNDDRQKLLTLLGLILYDTDEVNTRYRRADLPGLNGPSTIATLESWFNRVGKSLAPHDRLVYYFTGHGGGDNSAGRSGTPRNTTMYFWNNDDGYTVRQFETQLDKLDPQVEVTLIMVQCHSGGFANVIYKNADPAKGFSDHGFFSTTAPRLAAGCTPEIDEEDYHEFSTSFFEALCGESRTGKKVEKPDYDHDGHISYTEAFSYTLIHSPTIDIPMTTSDQLLIDMSRFADAANNTKKLLPKNAPWSEVLDAATPAQKVVLEALSTDLELAGEDRLTSARNLADTVNAQMNAPARTGRTNNRPARQGGRRAAAPNDNPRQRLQMALTERWPTLGVPLNPDIQPLVDAHTPEIMSFIKAQKDYPAFIAEINDAKAQSDRHDNAELKWVRIQRLLSRANAVILAHNLPLVATDETIKAYHTLIQLENKTLDNAPTP